MANVLDVAQYILATRGEMTAMKLQKLVYYSQAWSTVWDDDRLFPERILAWKNGPVVRELWEAHRGQFRVRSVPGNPENLTAEQRSTVDMVLSFYGDMNAQYLSDLTHMEDPWKEAWDPHAGNHGNTEIPLDKIAEYYSSIEPPSAPA